MRRAGRSRTNSSPGSLSHRAISVGDRLGADRDAGDAERRRSCRRRSRRTTRRRSPGCRPQRMIACGACSRDEPQPKLRFDEQDARRPEARIVERVRLAPAFASCARSSSNACSPRPSNVTHFRKRAGMMRSVSMSLPRTGMAVPVITVRCRVVPWSGVLPVSDAEDLAGVGDLAGDGGGRDHDRAHQQRAAGRASPAGP